MSPNMYSNFVGPPTCKLKIFREVNTLSKIYIKKEPSAKTQSVGQFKIDFEFEVPNELTVGESSSSHFKLLLLPPSSLEFVKEDSEFKSAGSKLTLAGGHTVADERTGAAMKKLSQADLGKCKATDAQKVLSSLGKEHKKSLGFTVKKDISSEILKMSSMKKVVVEIPFHKYTAKVAKGTYTWSGIFKARSNGLNVSGVTHSFDEFVVALGTFGYFVNDEDKYCLTQSATAAAIMFKRFDEMSLSMTSCSAIAATGMEKVIGMPKSVEPKLSASYRFESLERKLKLLFTVEIGYEIYDYAAEKLNLVFTVPKELKDTIVLSEKCTSEVKGSISVASCAYDAEKSQIALAVSKSDIVAATEMTFTVDVSNALLNAAPLSENHKYTLEVVLKDKEELAKVDMEKLKPEVTRAAALKTECIEPIMEMAKEMKEKPEPKPTSVGKQTSSDVKHEGKYIEYSYELEKAGKDFLMKIYLKNEASLKGKLNLAMHVKGHENFMTLKEPETAEAGTEAASVSNDGVKFNFNNIQVSVDFTDNTKVKKGTYFEIPVLFKTTLELEAMKAPNFFTLQVDKESGETLIYGIYKEIKGAKGAASALDRVYERGESTLYVSKFFNKGKKPAIMFKLTTQSEPKMSLLLEFMRPKGIVKYSHEIINDFMYKEEATFTNERYYRIAMEVAAKPKTKITSTIVLEITPEDKEFSMESLVFSVVSGHGEVSHLSPSEVLFTEELKFAEGDFEVVDLPVPCLTKDTKLSSSRFRMMENGNYIAARSVDCSRPWMPYVNKLGPEFDVTVENSDLVTGFTMKEVISLNDPLQSRVIEKLAGTKRFYEHTLYLFFDQMAVTTIKEHMIAGSVCVKSDSTCPDNNHLPVLTKFVTSLVEGVDLTLIKVMVAYLEGEKLELHSTTYDKKILALKSAKNYTGLKNTRVALEKLLDSAFESASADKIETSFSVLSVLDNDKVATVKSAVKEYEVPSDPRTNNEKYSNPVYIEIIPVDKTSTFEVKKMGCNTVKKTAVVKELLKLGSSDAVDRARLGTGSLGAQKGKVYTGYTFLSASKGGKVATLASGPRTPVTSALPTSPKRSEDHSLFFKIRDTLKPMCLKTVKPEELPLLVELKSVMKTMEAMAKSYHVIATCSKFKSAYSSRRETKYILSSRGVKLGEYTTKASEDIPDKLFSECDLFSLYKFLTLSKYSLATEPVSTE
ncbi:conserved hypothetical protein [Theileria orientalis strain Shintoku]|uniref:Uncharacterized protein n=1 Tax=Theileria orientalis strain Shintoku TaxID=869250 RepID=J4C996_THEOR|nr:conserved hypothetical protein [Theileria orientalis strain Shintoku]BAM42153.1 conserved hypothetical protein [Theileria orientalis strain Shintoku]|eukprot:XP_009692454.1 conserved hypothetical protein [Theileria orientalis strain Shintoku]